MKFLKQFRLIEILVLAALAFMVLAFIWAVIFAKRPDNWNYDPVTGTQTWTDDKGRDFIKSEDGSVRQIQ